MRSPSVDIVIIGRNEGDLLRIAIESSQRASVEFVQGGCPQPKIIYVDSYSTDGSEDLARSLGVECYQVTGKPSAAAGRHEGFKHCTGDYVYFMDGDMEIYSGWLNTSVTYLEDHPEIAGVAGICDWEVNLNSTVTKIPNHNGVFLPVQEITSDVGGSIIYRRSVLMEVGDFDPTVPRGEEFELYLRVIGGGYRAQNLQVPMCIHRDQKGGMGKGFIRQSLLSRSVFYAGVIARKAPIKIPVISMLLKRNWLLIWHPVSLCFMLLSILYAMQTNVWQLWALTLAVLIQLIIAHWIYKQRSIPRTLVSLVTANIYAPAFAIGFLTGWPKVGGYYRQIPSQNKVK